MKSVRFESLMKRDMKRIKRRHYDTEKLGPIFDVLCMGSILPPSLHPHLLQGKWIGCWECHVVPNCLLIYKVTDAEVILARTGNHADLFE